MSNEMFLVRARFHIDPGEEKAAEAALRAVAVDVLEKQRMRAGDIQNIAGETEGEVDHLTLDRLVQCWGWSLIGDLANETDEIIGIRLLEDFSSDEETLFDTLAPFVSADSFIDLEGKRSGIYWTKRYGFTGKRVVEVEPVFPPIPLSQFSRAKIQAAIDANRKGAEPQSIPINLYRIPTGYIALALIQLDYSLCFLVEAEGALECVVRIPLTQAVNAADARSLAHILSERCLGATKIPLR